MPALFAPPVDPAAVGAGAAADGGGPESDGRRRRRTQNREAVLDALVSLFDEGVYEPSSAEIAERAGLSPRSLFRYFDDVDDLSRAAIERQLAAALPLVEPGVGSEAPLPARIAELVDARVRLYEAIEPAARAGTGERPPQPDRGRPGA